MLEGRHDLARELQDATVPAEQHTRPPMDVLPVALPSALLCMFTVQAREHATAIMTRKVRLFSVEEILLLLATFFSSILFSASFLLLFSSLLTSFLVFLLCFFVSFSRYEIADFVFVLRRFLEEVRTDCGDSETGCVFEVAQNIQRDELDDYSFVPSSDMKWPLTMTVSNATVAVLAKQPSSYEPELYITFWTEDPDNSAVAAYVLLPLGSLMVFAGLFIPIFLA